MAFRVLIAEPDDCLRESYERYLSKLGFVVESASTLGECMKKSTDVAPDVILAELDFSDGSADDMLRTLAKRVPVVILTRRVDDTGIVGAWPVHAYFQKPVLMSRLTETLSNCGQQGVLALE